MKVENRLDSKSTCPNCSKTLDGFNAVNGEDDKSNPEDITVCLYCGELLEFDKDLKLIFIPEENISKIDLKAVQYARFIRQQFLDRKG